MILVIEDNTACVGQWRRIFGMWGWDEKVLFDSPTTAEEAIDLIERVQPGVVCLDMNFDDNMLQEGVEVAEWIDRHVPETLVLSISGHRQSFQKDCYAGISCVKHFPGKNPFEVKKCLEGTCPCLRENAAA